MGKTMSTSSKGRTDVALYRWSAWEQEKHRREEGAVWVSDLVSCPKKREMERLYPEVAGLGFFNPAALLGDIVHRGVYSILGELGVPATFEVEGEMEFQGLRIRGRADILTEDRVIDIKTARSDYGIPHTHHLLQVRIYMRMFNRPKGSILYITKDRIAEISEAEEASLSKPVADEELRMILDSQKVPMYEEFECDYCPYSRACPSKVTKGGGGGRGYGQAADL
jgi:CRISPR-associated exonuclease Cas4